MNEQMSVVLVDKQGRFVGLEGTDFALKEVSYPKPKKTDVLSWNTKPVVSMHVGCSNCGSTSKHLSVKCHHCDTRVYCSSQCSANDMTHRMNCITIGPRMHRIHRHSRFPMWARTFSSGLYYNPLWYPYYRDWYRPWPRYQRVLALPPLPQIAPSMTYEQINEELAKLRTEHKDHRQQYGAEIVPDPANGRYIWIKPA